MKCSMDVESAFSKLALLRNDEYSLKATNNWHLEYKDNDNTTIEEASL